MCGVRRSIYLIIVVIIYSYAIHVSWQLLFVENLGNKCWSIDHPFIDSLLIRTHQTERFISFRVCRSVGVCGCKCFIAQLKSVSTTAHGRSIATMTRQ